MGKQTVLKPSYNSVPDTEPTVQHVFYLVEKCKANPAAVA